ncbi:CAP domain-containing protein [Cystobacter ferrugineus]|nr:CAP domain-containing protein [Cystobacter ferrugineus]
MDPGLEQEAGSGESSSTTAAAETPASAPSALALPAYCNGVLNWNPAWTAFEDEVLKLVNQQRAAGATCGGVAKPKVPALTFDERLRCAARVHSTDMGTNNFMSHTGSDGSTPWQRMTNAGYVWRSAAENVAAGYATPAAVVAGWMKSTGHCNNIMGSGVKHLGVGYYYAPSSTYKHYWTQSFGAQ